MFMLPPILDWSNYLQQHLRSCTGLLRFYLTFELYIPELASTCIAFRLEKVPSLFGMPICPMETGTNLTLFKTYVWNQLTFGHSNRLE